MSSMKISKESDERMSESRTKLVNAFYMAYGSYVEQEAKKLDQWRDESFYDLYRHAKHEFLELERSKAKTVQLHNTMDLVMLSTIMLAKLLDEES